MTITTFCIFIVLFIAPSLYQRIHYKLKPEHFYTLRLRKKSGLQIHHAHWGLLYILISSMWLIFAEKNMWIVLLAGLGWGLLCDEIIPHLKMPSDDRAHELKVYVESTRPTIILLAILVGSFTALFFVLH